MEMKKLSGLDYGALVLVVIGGINWALVGMLNFNLVTFIFGDMSMLTRIVYVLVGLGALYVLVSLGSYSRK